MTEKIIVTRHAALARHLVEIGEVPAGTPVIERATEDDVRGKHVIGVLPTHLAAVAEAVTEVPMDTPPKLRGVELDIHQVRKYALDPVTYRVMTDQEAMGRSSLAAVHPKWAVTAEWSGNGADGTGLKIVGYHVFAPAWRMEIAAEDALLEQLGNPLSIEVSFLAVSSDGRELKWDFSREVISFRKEREVLR